MKTLKNKKLLGLFFCTAFFMSGLFGWPDWEDNYYNIRIDNKTQHEVRIENVGRENNSGFVGPNLKGKWRVEPGWGWVQILEKGPPAKSTFMQIELKNFISKGPALIFTKDAKGQETPYKVTTYTVDGNNINITVEKK